jgi:two-component system, OmpR family, alkaline phosphatase synthesis response regulator PhoP
MSSRLLLVEDEPGLLVTISDLLGSEGHHIDTAADGESGLAKALAGKYDLIVLDVMLPKKTGLEVCRALREKGNDTAVLMLTAKSHVSDRVIGLKLGADDYLGKPFNPAELLARVEALLRRVTKENRIAVRSFEFSGIAIDFERSEVRRDHQPVALAQKEMQLLRYLIDHRERVVTREELLREIWEYSSEISSRTIDVHIAWLRQKLEPDPQSPRHIQTIRGKGYRFTP